MDFALQSSGTYDDVLKAARFAEQRGLAAFALPDHYLQATDEEQAKTTPAPDAFAHLAGLARETSSIELVVLVSPITFRHPAVLAKTAVTIDRMSEGRFSLGLGTGWMDREHEVFGFDYPPIGERFAMLEEALGYVSAALADDPLGFGGEHYRLEPFPLSPRPVGRIKLIVGGTGPHRTPYLAGTYADEFNVYPGADLEARIDRCRAAAQRAGRDPDDLLLSSAGLVVAAATEQGLEETLDRRAGEAGMSREQLSEHFARRNTPVGTYDALRAQFADMSKLGITRFYLQGGFDPEETGALIDALAG
ncbi:MAG: LLM class F420-dependent oxidoreductase [Acidimicrobiia bacterium]|nr:MAG: LLM class F420-dependent oxidoreductase [Acidimicrobiia bacterium]